MMPIPSVIDMRRALYKHFFKSFEILVSGVHVPAWRECDIVGISYDGHVELFNLSLTELKGEGADNTKRLLSGHTPINRYWYVSPAGLFDHSELPQYAGLLVMHRNGRLVENVPAPMLHGRRVELNFKYELARTLCWKALRADLFAKK